MYRPVFHIRSASQTAHFDPLLPQRFSPDSRSENPVRLNFFVGMTQNQPAMHHSSDGPSSSQLVTRELLLCYSSVVRYIGNFNLKMKSSNERDRNWISFLPSFDEEGKRKRRIVSNYLPPRVASRRVPGRPSIATNSHFPGRLERENAARHGRVDRGRRSAGIKSLPQFFFQAATKTGPRGPKVN